MKLLEARNCRTRQFKPTNEDYLKISYKLNFIGDETYVDCNYTVFKKFGPIAVTIRMYQLLANNQDKLVYKMNSLSCKTLLMQQFIRLNQVPIDKDCNALPTTITLLNRTTEKTSWLWIRGANKPGRYAYELEYSCRDTSVACSRLVADIFTQKH